MPFALTTEHLLNMANTKLQSIDGLRADRPDIAQVVATEALTLATMANAQATVFLAQITNAR